MDSERTFEGPAAVGIIATALTVVIVWEFLPGEGTVGRLASMALAPVVGVLVGSLLASWSLMDATVRERVFLCLFAGLVGLAGAAFLELWWLHAACGGEACQVPVGRTQTLVFTLPLCIPSWLAGALVPPAVESREDPTGFPHWPRLMFGLGALGLVLLALGVLLGAPGVTGRLATVSDTTALLVGVALLPAILALGSLPSVYRLGRAAQPSPPTPPT